jgi:hypothetical protein
MSIRHLDLLAIGHHEHQDGWKTQSRKPPSRRDSGNLISLMRIPERGCRGIPRLRLGSRETEKATFYARRSTAAR